MFELVIGIHSIKAVLEVRPQAVQVLFATEEGLSEFLQKSKWSKNHLKVKPQLVSPHLLQEKAKEYFKQLDLEPMRVPSQIFAVVEPLETFDLNWLKQQIHSSQKMRYLALDQVSDVHNGAAILRTAAFFGLDGVLLPSEKSFGFTPSFYRIASGATEYLKLIRCQSLSKALLSLKDDGFQLVGLSEHSNVDISNLQVKDKVVLVLGAEDVGLSNAVSRNMDTIFSLPAQGKIQSLNVSTAAAIAMDICFPLKA
jgi:23S rRNA (guanosine2251-2'-O)-methyltransferase